MASVSERFDPRRVHHIIRTACGQYVSLREARVAGLPMMRARDEVVALCMPLATKFVAKINLPASSRVERGDLEQAACWAIVEAVDSFDHTKGVNIQTHLWNRMRLRVQRERDAQHWTVMKPPRWMSESYMSGRMNSAEKQQYLDRFINPGGLTHE